MTIAKPLNLLFGKRSSSHLEKEVLYEDAITTASSPACVMSNMVLYLLAIGNGEMIHRHLLQASPILPESFFSN